MDLLLLSFFPFRRQIFKQLFLFDPESVIHLTWHLLVPFLLVVLSVDPFRATLEAHLAKHFLFSFSLQATWLDSTPHFKKESAIHSPSQLSLGFFEGSVFGGLSPQNLHFVGARVSSSSVSFFGHGRFRHFLTYFALHFAPVSSTPQTLRDLAWHVPTSQFGAGPVLTFFA